MEFTNYVFFLLPILLSKSKHRKSNSGIKINACEPSRIQVTIQLQFRCLRRACPGTSPAWLQRPWLYKLASIPGWLSASGPFQTFQVYTCIPSTQSTFMQKLLFKPFGLSQNPKPRLYILLLKICLCIIWLHIFKSSCSAYNPTSILPFISLFS